MIILGLNAYNADSSACIVKDGVLIAAIEEERIRRVKHWAGFPSEAIKACLVIANISISDVDYIAINHDPKANASKKVLSALTGLSPKLVMDRFKNAQKTRDIKLDIMIDLKVKKNDIKAKIYNIEHHIAHLASAFFVSPFTKSAIVSVDDFGDFVSAMWGVGNGKTIEVKDRVFFPHSLGLFYLALTQYLGFTKYGDEYKVMGLASYGKPTEMNTMEKVLALDDLGRFKLGLDYFTNHIHGAAMTWDGGEPVIGSVYSPILEALFGPARKKDEPITKHHENIAASMQATYEGAFFNLLNYVQEQTKETVLCLAGGCAMNILANGKIISQTLFKDVYIPSAAGDAGGSIGAVYYLYHNILEKDRFFVMSNAYWGPEYNEVDIQVVLNKNTDELSEFKIEKIIDEDDLCRKTAKEIANGKIIGWFQGRMEWGSSVLGNRSILVDPRKAEMKRVLNSRIKHRESFRPFAASILFEKVDEYFDEKYPDPFMMNVYPVKKEKRNVIPAVTNIDGSGCFQTVTKEENPLYWKLIKEFEKITGVPVLLNTSFNENEPIVCKPEEALDCFLRTKMDILVLGPYIIKKDPYDH